MLCHPYLHGRSILLAVELVVLPAFGVLSIGWPRFVGPVSALRFVISWGLAMGSRWWWAQGSVLGIGPAAANNSLKMTAGELRCFGTFRVLDVGCVGVSRPVYPPPHSLRWAASIVDKT